MSIVSCPSGIRMSDLAIRKTASIEADSETVSPSLLGSRTQAWPTSKPFKSLNDSLLDSANAARNLQVANIIVIRHRYYSSLHTHAHVFKIECLSISTGKLFRGAGTDVVGTSKCCSIRIEPECLATSQNALVRAVAKIYVWPYMLSY